MFKVFSIFNVLFSRPRIRGAIQEYQNQLLGQVKKDIEQLKEKLIAENMKDQTLTRVRDFPRVSNRITWTKQLERKLKFYMGRVQEVLGDNWQMQHEGKELKGLGETFQLRLTRMQQSYFDEWLKELTDLNVPQEREKTLFIIEQRVDKFNLAINFNEKLFHLFKEQINLKRLGLKPALSVVLKADEVKDLYPVAMSLQESLRTF